MRTLSIGIGLLATILTAAPAAAQCYQQQPYGFRGNGAYESYPPNRQVQNTYAYRDGNGSYTQYPYAYRSPYAYANAYSNGYGEYGNGYRRYVGSRPTPNGFPGYAEGRAQNRYDQQNGYSQYSDGYDASQQGPYAQQNDYSFDEDVDQDDPDAPEAYDTPGI